MSSLVSDFIINPVLRQARRFSEISRTTVTGEDHEPTPPSDPDTVSDSGTAGSVLREALEQLETPGVEPIARRPETPRSPAVSTSTQETRVADAPETPPSVDNTTHDHLGFPLSPRRGRAIPEDDGMHELRRRIQAINSEDAPSAEKARRMHELLLEGYRASQVANRRKPTPPMEEESLGHQWGPSTSPGPLESLKSWYNHATDQPSTADKFILSDNDIAPTFAPIRPRKGSDVELQGQGSTTPPESQAPLGCQHYERNVKLQCFTCKKWYTCRFCHDAAEDHSLVRRETRNMLCMLCGTPQKASDMCINCGEVSAHYYCNICKLWENRKSKPIYHCNDCGICRRGLGLGKDFFHCKVSIKYALVWISLHLLIHFKTCRACITTSIQSSHKCIERSTDCDCPICGEYMFTSPKPVVFMTCGHSIHKKCYDQHMKVSYKCPICNKSLANMGTQFRNLDVAIINQPMPPEFRDTKATVLCNDCSGKCTVPYHWLGLKCSICQSYNTVELQIHGQGSQELQTAAERAEAAASAQQSSPDTQRPAMTPPATSSRAGTWIPNRRRHSSHGIELQHHAPDRFARSLSPLESGIDSHLAQIAADIDSDDDILGLWRGNRSQDQAEDEDEDDLSEEESDSDLDSDGINSADEDEDEDDDDDDDDDILLIGHR